LEGKENWKINSIIETIIGAISEQRSERKYVSSERLISFQRCSKVIERIPVEFVYKYQPSYAEREKGERGILGAFIPASGC